MGPSLFFRDVERHAYRLVCNLTTPVKRATIGVRLPPRDKTRWWVGACLEVCAG